VHVIDADGFADFVDGLPARCRNLRDSGKNVRVVPEPGEGVLGGPLQPHAAVVHEAAELARDMSALDAGTKAHEETVEALAAHLHRAGHLAPRPTPESRPARAMSFLARAAFRDPGAAGPPNATPRLKGPL
jgi:hypothetical protein